MCEITITGSGLAKSAIRSIPPFGDPVEQQIGELADLRLELADAPRGKGAAYQPPQPGMDRRIREHHARRVAENADALFEEPRARRHARKMFMVVQHGGAIGVARYQRHRQKDVEQPRRARHQRLVIRVGIGAKRLIPRVEIDLLGFAHAAAQPPRPSQAHRPL